MNWLIVFTSLTLFQCEPYSHWLRNCPCFEICIDSYLVSYCIVYLTSICYSIWLNAHNPWVQMTNVGWLVCLQQYLFWLNFLKKTDSNKWPGQSFFFSQSYPCILFLLYQPITFLHFYWPLPLPLPLALLCCTKY